MSPNEFEEQLRALPPFSRQVKALTRHLASRAADCALDVQGRILVLPALRRIAGLGREAVVVAGSVDPGWGAGLGSTPMPAVVDLSRRFGAARAMADPVGAVAEAIRAVLPGRG